MSEDPGRTKKAAGALGVIIAVVGVSVLLLQTYGQVVDAATIVGDIHTAVEEAVGAGGPIIQDVDVVGNAVIVTISDSTNIDAGLVEDAVRSAVGPDVTVIVTSP